MYIIIILLLFTSCVKSNDEELEVIARLGVQKISGGWSKLNIETIWNDKILFSYDDDEGEFNEISISNSKYTITVDKKYLDVIKEPFLGTLSDIWFETENHYLNSFDFEFHQLHYNVINKGRFKVKFNFYENEIDQIIIYEYNLEENSWDHKFDLVVEMFEKDD